MYVGAHEPDVLIRRGIRQLAIENSEKMLEANAQPGYKREVRKFTVPDVRVSSDALVLQVDFELTVK